MKENSWVLQIGNKIVRELKTNDFCNVSKKYSDEEKKCELYTIERGTVSKEYEKAVFSQGINAVSVVSTEQGINFVQTLNKLDYNFLPMKDVEERIVKSVEKEKKDATYKEYISSLREKAKITNYLQK